METKQYARVFNTIPYLVEDACTDLLESNPDS